MERLNLILLGRHTSGADGFGYRKSTADQNNGRVSVGIKVDELSVG